MVIESSYVPKKLVINNYLALNDTEVVMNANKVIPENFVAVS